MDWNNFYLSSLGGFTTNSNPSSVINLFKLSKDYTPPEEEPKSPKFDYTTNLKYNKLFERELHSSSIVDFQKDLQLWDRDKLAVIDILTKRLRNLDESKTRQNELSTFSSHKGKAVSQKGSDEPDVLMSNECELLLSWFDKYFYDNERVTEEAHRIFFENAAKLLAKDGLKPMNFLNFLIDIGKLANNKSPNILMRYLRVSLKHLEKQAWGSLHISMLNLNGVFMNNLVFNENTQPLDVLKTFVECANILYPSKMTYMEDNTISRDPEYYFFIAYLLFRSGSLQSLELLLNPGDHDLLSLNLDHKNFPPLFSQLCEMLKNVLQEKDDPTRQFFLSQFSSEYYPPESTQASSLSRVSNYYALLLLSILYPDYYPPCEPNSMATKEDYLWYQIWLMLSNTGSNLVLSSYKLCNSLTQEVNLINSNDPDLVDRILSYAYSIALAGGIMESLRLLMSAVKVSSVQTLVVFFVVYFENYGLFEFEDLKYISHTLWNMTDKFMQAFDDLSYLVQLAFNRKRSVSPELKILLSTMLPQSKNIMAVKYAVSENFNDAVNPCYLGSSLTKNGMLLVGPLLQKLIKLSSKRNAAKYAILLLAQYSAHVGLWACAFKCFYCIQDVENCSSVLEACCCYLYDNDETNQNKSFTIDDLVVYYTLTKNLGPNNKHVLELKNTFNCIKLSSLVKNSEYLKAVSYCKANKIFENAVHILRNESHQIYFQALFSYIKALKFLVSTGKQPAELLSSTEANLLLDLLEAAHQNPNTDKNLTVEALHLLLTFISIVPPK